MHGSDRNGSGRSERRGGSAGSTGSSYPLGGSTGEVCPAEIREITIRTFGTRIVQVKTSHHAFVMFVESRAASKHQTGSDPKESETY